MNIAIGADHRGFEYKKQLLLLYPQWIDVGAYDNNRSDFPLFAKIIAQKVQEKEVDAGVLLCGTGIGMNIAANRLKRVYAGIAWNEEIARLAKEHDNVNVLVIPADFISFELTQKIIKSWINASFLEGHYSERLNAIDE